MNTDRDKSKIEQLPPIVRMMVNHFETEERFSELTIPPPFPAKDNVGDTNEVTYTATISRFRRNPDGSWRKEIIRFTWTATDLKLAEKALKRAHEDGVDLDTLMKQAKAESTVDLMEHHLMSTIRFICNCGATFTDSQNEDERDAPFIAFKLGEKLKGELTGMEIFVQALKDDNASQ